MERNIFERMLEGESIAANHPEYGQVLEACNRTRKLVRALNNEEDPEQIRNLLSRITGREIDASTTLFPPLHINYGRNTLIGKSVFINFDCVFLDLGGIIIEDNVLIAPKVSLLSEGHSIEPEQRQTLVPGKIHIKKNAWIGSNATVLAGVTIGENSIVAAGSVVSKDVPDNVIVGGIPAKIIRII